MSGNTTQMKGASKTVLGMNAVVVYVFFYAPIALLVFFSFSDDNLVGRWGGFTFRWYEAFAQNDEVQGALSISVRVAVVSTLVSVVLGTMAALSLERYRFRGNRFFDALLYLPVIVPDVTMAVMMLLFFAASRDLLDALFGFCLLYTSPSPRD